MATFGRMRLDVENCLRELVEFGIVQRAAGPAGAVSRRVRPEGDAINRLLDTFLERRADISTEDQAPSVQRFREMIGRDEKMLDRLRVDSHGRQVRHLGADPRTDRLRQGSRRADDPRAESARHRELPGRELRGAARHALRVGNLRLRKGRVHRRARSQARTRRARRSRHAVPRRNRRPVARRAGQAAARARGPAIRAAGRTALGAGGLPPDLGDEPAARSVRSRQPLPRGPVLPRERVLDPAALAARAADRHRRARQSVHCTVLRGQRACRSTRRCSRPRRWRGCNSYPWPGNIRELESTVSRAALSAPGRVIRDTDIEFLHPQSPRQPPRRRRVCRPWPRPSARTSCACSKPRPGTRRRPPGSSTISRGTLYRKIVEYGLEPKHADVPKQSSAVSAVSAKHSEPRLIFGSVIGVPIWNTTRSQPLTPIAAAIYADLSRENRVQILHTSRRVVNGELVQRTYVRY